MTIPSMPPQPPASHEESQALRTALQRADDFDMALIRAIEAEHYRLYDDSARMLASASAASVSLEHGRAMRVLLADGLPTSAISLLRLQHEALTRAIWLLYAADEEAITKLSTPLSKEAEAAAGKLPMMAEMLKQLARAPGAAQPLASLLAFKTNNSTSLNSLVHGGIHALQRHAQGYPLPLLIGQLRNCNGLMLIAANLLAMLTGRKELAHPLSQLQVTFATDLPPPLPVDATGLVQPETATTKPVAVDNAKNPSK